MCIENKASMKRCLFLADANLIVFAPFPFYETS
jgi:hypothetical protein